jgi:hypothetical protein
VFLLHLDLSVDQGKEKKRRSPERMLQCRHNDDALLLCKPGLNNLLRLRL